jgi:hypothetical protein
VSERQCLGCRRLGLAPGKYFPPTIIIIYKYVIINIPRFLPFPIPSASPSSRAFFLLAAIKTFFLSLFGPRKKKRRKKSTRQTFRREGKSTLSAEVEDQTSLTNGAHYGVVWLAFFYVFATILPFLPPRRSFFFCEPTRRAKYLLFT